MLEFIICAILIVMFWPVVWRLLVAAGAILITFVGVVFILILIMRA